jgi:hypothetical protein
VPVQSQRRPRHVESRLLDVMFERDLAQYIGLGDVDAVGRLVESARGARADSRRSKTS